MDTFANSPLGNLEALDYFLIGLTAAGAAMISAMSGMGGGLILAVVVAPIVGVKALVPLMAVLSLFTNFGRIIFYFRSLDVRIAMLVFWPSLPGSWLGTTLYAHMNAGTLAVMLGVILVGAVPLKRYLAGKQWVAGPRTLIGMGALFGFASGITIGAGLILIPVLLGAGLIGPALLGTDAIIGIFNTIFRAGMFAWHGLLPIDLVIAGVLIGICTLPGSWAATQIIKRTDIRLHTMSLEILIAAGGISFIWRGLEAWGYFEG
jgi:uncharacterized membrane protein YfcA